MTDDDPLDDYDSGNEDDRPGVSQLVGDAVANASQRVGPALSEARDRVGPALSKAAARGRVALSSGQEQARGRYNWPVILGVLLALAISAGAVGGVWYLAGALDAVIYALLFIGGAALVPVGILMFAPSLPRAIAAPLGRGMWILQQVVYGTGYLVEFDSEYRACPGDDGEVYIDGEWHNVDGMEDMTVLGWKPFGTLRYKDDDTLSRERVDNEINEPATDGGSSPGAADIATMNLDDVMATTVRGKDQTRTRGGYTDFGLPERADNWVLDLKTVYNSGLKKIGDIANIEQSEEVAMREDAKEGVTSGNEVLIGSVVGLLLGIASGYVTLFV